MFDYFYTNLQSNFLEVPIYFLIYWLWQREISWKSVLFTVTFANALTHPWVFFGFMGVEWSYFWSVLLAELFAVLTEGPLHSYALARNLLQTWIAALVANIFSWQVAPILTYWLFF